MLDMSGYDSDEEHEELDDEQLERFSESVPANPAPVTLAPEPLFSALLKQCVAPNEDPVLYDYIVHVVPHLSAHLGHVAAKGGEFALKKRAEGKSPEEVARYGDDQTMRAHVMNGLLPVARIARTLKAWNIGQCAEHFDEATYRLFVAGYTLHDWLKLPHIDTELREVGLGHNSVNVARDLQVVEDRILAWCARLGLDTFLAPIGSADSWLHDIIYIATNTQRYWGVMLNLRALPRMRHDGRGIDLATQLATLADYLAYLGRNPMAAATNQSIARQLHVIAGDSEQVRLTYHHLSDVRGVITNIVHSAAEHAYTDDQFRLPLLYAPTGVVYLTRAQPPTPDVATVADDVIRRIQQQCRTQLERDLTGFNRDGKGLKYADYYNLFFTPAQLARFVARFAEKRMMFKSDAQKRYDSIAAKGMATTPLARDLPVEPEVDRIAEVSALLVKLASTHAPAFDAEGWLLEQLGAGHLREEMRHINSNRTAGGVPYGWYYVAAWHRKHNPGKDPEQWNVVVRALADGVAAQLPETTGAAGWADIHRYVCDHLRFAETAPVVLHERMHDELERYQTARKQGRGATRLCALCSSPYTVQVQQEAATLFAPMVYTNKQPLHGSVAIRHICAVCSMEMMLRQLFMKRGRESGGNFEKRKLRYLFFYPTYFFTPETLKLLRIVQDDLKRVSFTELRKLLTPDATTGTYQLEPALFQHLYPLMLHPRLLAPAERDRLFRLDFPAHEHITFSFIGVPPGDRDAKDAEAWINPAFLALVLPLLLDIKVVASEGMIPPIQEANELSETVAFDGAHPFVGYLTGLAPRQKDAPARPAGRFNVDEVVPALQSLVAAYFIHMDGNARTGATGYDYRWHEIGPLARNLATSPLYAFHYLKKSLRRDGNDTPGGYKAAQYVSLVDDYIGKGDPHTSHAKEDGDAIDAMPTKIRKGGPHMSHAKELVSRYRRFYRHGQGRMNSNAILRPIREAADTLLEANLRLFDTDDALQELIRGRLHKSVEGLSRPGASGRVPNWLFDSDPKVRAVQLDSAINDFADYFINTLYRGVFAGNRAALAGKQLNLLKNACEAIYIAEQRREWLERNEQPEEVQTSQEEQE